MSRLHSDFLLPLFHPDRHTGLGRRLRALEHFDTLSRHEQAALQEQRVRAILDHAYLSCPYYRLICDEIGFRAADWRAAQPIPLPELTRSLLCGNLEDIGSRAFRGDRLRRFVTACGPAPRIALDCDLEGLRDQTAVEYHLDRLSGFDHASRVLRIEEGAPGHDGRSAGRWRLLAESLLDRAHCCALPGDDASLRGIVDTLNRWNPEVVCARSGALLRLAACLRSSGMRWRTPRLVVAVGESLTADERRAIGETFSCDVTVHYARCEFGKIAVECEAGRLHFHPWACYVELLPAGRVPAGPLYRLVITGLLNYGMPLLCYDTEDCVLFDESRCPCGCWYPSVAAVLPRSAGLPAFSAPGSISGPLPAGQPCLPREDKTSVA